MLSVEAQQRMPPSPPTLCSDLSSRSARAWAVTAFAFVWDPKAGKLEGMASSGRSPKSLSLATVRSRAKDGVLPKLGAVTVSTPGALDGWWRCTSATESSSGQSCSSRPFIYCEIGAPVPQIIGFYLKRIWRPFSIPDRALKKQPMPWQPIRPAA